MATRRRRAIRRRSVGSPQLSKWRKKYERAVESTKRARRKAGETADTVVRSGTVVGSAYATGMVQTYFGQVDVFGVSGELLVFAGGHIMAFMGVGGKTANTALRNIADGVGAAWAAQAGQEMGAKIKARGGALPEGTSPDALAEGYDYSLAGGADGLSALDLANVARSY